MVIHLWRIFVTAHARRWHRGRRKFKEVSCMRTRSATCGYGVAEHSIMQDNLQVPHTAAMGLTPLPAEAPLRAQSEI
jgi:hypothetical protein